MKRCQHYSTIHPTLRCGGIATVALPNDRGGYRFVCGRHALAEAGDLWGHFALIDFELWVGTQGHETPDRPETFPAGTHPTSREEVA